MILKRIIRVYLIIGKTFGKWITPIITGILISLLRVGVWFGQKIDIFIFPSIKKKLKSQKTIAIIQAIVVVLMIVFSLFSLLEKGISFQTFLPLFFVPMFFVMLFEVKKIKKELASRK